MSDPHDRNSGDVLDYCELRGIAFIAWLPIQPSVRSGTVATRLGATPVQVALAWL